MLQDPAIDIADAIHLIESLTSHIYCKGDAVDTFHKKCYSDIFELACKVVLKKAKREHQSCTGIVIFESELTSDYLKKVMTISLLDHLTVEIEKTFDHAYILVYGDLVIVPSKMVSLVYKNFNWKEKFNLFADLFKDDISKRWRQNWIYGNHNH